MNFPRKFYLHREELQPDTAAQNAIRHGLWMQGVETVDFTSMEDIATFEDLAPDVGVAGYIGDVLKALQVMGLDPPLLLDYPEVLKPFLRREVYQTTFGAFRDVKHAGPLFIKPAKDHKLFTGLVWEGTREQRFLLGPVQNDVPIWVSEPLNFVSEYRTFILNGEVLDCRRYKGDWSKAPDRLIVSAAVAFMNSVAPVAYCLDFGITDKGETTLVEANDGFAMGPYGLAPPQYACMIASRWRELCSPRK